MKNKIARGLIRFLIEVIVIILLIVGIRIVTNGMYLWGLPDLEDIQSVNITYPSVTVEVKEISSHEDIELALKLTGFLKYDLFEKAGSEEEPLITMTCFLKDGTDKTISANNTTVWWNNKTYAIKDKETFINLVEGIFFLEDLQESPLTDNVPVVAGENQAEDSNVINAEELADTFGISIVLPENSTWIADEKYYLVDENNLEITYHDFIVDSDCTLLVSKNRNLNLPQNEYDETRNESWEGKTVSGQNIVVKVQHESDNGKMLLATWEYNEYQFAIIGEDKDDSKSIPKTALYIIYNL